jgi:hypothetical protein
MTEKMGSRIVTWLLTGEPGQSSMAMAAAFWGLPPEHNQNFRAHPWDPADFRRCLLFLEVIPEGRERMDRLRALSPQWNALVDHWAELEALFIEEAPPHWKEPNPHWMMPRTYARMQEILDAATGGQS